MLQRLIRTFSSLRFTLVVILSLSAVFLLGLWIPQKGLLKRDLYLKWKADSPALVSFLEALGLTDIYTAPITLVLWSFFFLNLCLVMWRQVSVVRSRLSVSEGRIIDPETAAGYTHRTSIADISGEGLDSLGSILRQHGYVLYSSPQAFYAVKNRLSPLATLMFHLSFILILLGGVMSIYTRFSATADVAEGEIFTSRMDAYNQFPRMPKIGRPPDVRFMVEKVTPVTEMGTPTRLIVDIRDEKGVHHPVEINKPYKKDHTSFVIQDIGVAPLVILKDRNGTELDGAYVKLNVLRGRQDIFTMHGIEFSVDFFPDYVVSDGIEKSKSEEIINPAFRFHIQKERRFLGRKTVRPGGDVSFGDYRLMLPEMRYWVRFYVVRERGLGILYTGFSVATIALVWRLVFYRREIVGKVTQADSGHVLHIAGRAEFYRALFSDEFEKIVASLAAWPDQSQ